MKRLTLLAILPPTVPYRSNSKRFASGISGSFASGCLLLAEQRPNQVLSPYVVTTVGGCGVASLSGKITISPNVTIALHSAPGTAHQVLCINEPIAPITYLLGNGANGCCFGSRHSSGGC
ncbi:MAG: hypothetical protein U0X58_03995 [Flavobacteriaceae bacterium]